jgi:hypothetical protein
MSRKSSPGKSGEAKCRVLLAMAGHPSFMVIKLKGTISCVRTGDCQPINVFETTKT